MINPYKNVKWDSALHIKSMSHMHIYCQRLFETAMADGFKHVASTCYQPSVPTYPINRFFANIPDDVIGSPNSEKVYTLNSGGVHFCALGSFAMGHGHTEGATATWQDAFDQIIRELQFEDGGGITINHPGYPDIPLEKLIEMLDHDDRVLGIEIYNCGTFGYKTETQFIDYWDSVLKTGRRCWGFSVIDWYGVHGERSTWGSNVLLVPEFTEHACLKAYRDGAFYAQIKDTGLRFTGITFENNVMSVSTNRECEIKFVTSSGVAKTVVGTSAECEVADGEIYIRAEAKEVTDPDSRIFTNPVMLKRS